MSGTKKIWLRRALSWGLTIVAVAFVVTVVPFRDRCTEAGCEPGLLSTLRSTNLAALLGLFALYLLGSLAWAARWNALLGIAGVKLPLGKVWRVTLEAQAGGILLPGGIAGDALRVTYAKNAAGEAELGKILASIFADRIIGLVTLVVLALIAALGFGAGDMGPALPVLAAIPIGATLGWTVLRHPTVARASFFQRGIVGRLTKPLFAYASAPGGGRVLLRGFGLSLVVSGIQLLVVRGLVAAVGASPAHEGWMYVGTTFSMIVGAVPALPGGWGTADAAFVFFLARAGVAASVAAAACLLYRIFWYASGIIGALLSLARPSS